MARWYDVFFKDGSVERVEADNIAEARQEARELSPEDIKRVIFVEEIDNEDDTDEVEEEVVPANSGDPDEGDEEDDDE